jgi:hypothetical protein
MKTQVTQDVLAPVYADTLFDWKPDLARYAREVGDSASIGICDELTLAEMECSLDLLDAELVALRGRPYQDEATKDSTANLLKVRGQLVRLIARLKSLTHA